MKMAIISDLHIGAIPADILRNEIRNEFFTVLKNEEVDIVVIAGDLLDHKLSFNSEDSKLAIEFIEELSKSYKVRILKGTKTHDLNQLSNFAYLEEKSDVDVKVFNVMTTEIIDNIKLLYMPEEYLEDYFSTYEEILNPEEPYNIALFHGTWNFAGYISKIQESERSIKHAPLFKYEDLKDIAQIFIGGHIHTGDTHGNVFYTGSFSRWCMGEENRKGFIIAEFDENGYRDHTFHENKLARKFITLDVNEIIKSEGNVEEKIKYIEKMKNDKGIHKLRIKFDSDSDDLQSTIIRDYFSKGNDIKVDIKNLSKEKETEEEQKITDEYSFIFNRDYDMAHMISMYLKKHDNIELSAERISELLLED